MGDGEWEEIKGGKEERAEEAEVEAEVEEKQEEEEKEEEEQVEQSSDNRCVHARTCTYY